jgi:hypothetical protein
MKPTMQTNAGRRGGRYSSTMPEGEGSMKTNVYGVWNLALTVGCRTNSNDPPIDAHDCIHACTPICTSAGTFFVFICSSVDGKPCARLCRLPLPFTPSAARQPDITTTITVHCSDSVQANAIYFLSRALVFHKARAVVAAWVSYRNTTPPPIKNFPKHLSPQHILRAANIPNTQPNAISHSYTHKFSYTHTNIKRKSSSISFTSPAWPCTPLSAQQTFATAGLLFEPPTITVNRKLIHTAFLPFLYKASLQSTFG